LADGEAAARAAGEDERPQSRGEQRRQAFLDAAIDVFLEQGFECASVNEIVRRAGGSLAPLNAQFGNKEGLFETVIAEATQRFSEPYIRAADLDRPLAEGLQDIGEQFLTMLIQPRSLAFFRLMIAEGRKAPGVGEAWLHGGPERVRAAVADYLIARGAREGVRITPHDAAIAGGFFCDMVRSRHQYRGLFQTGTYSLTPQAVRDHVATAVRMLLDGLRMRA
jgi:AcrR family transcriptional regulator